MQKHSPFCSFVPFYLLNQISIIGPGPGIIGLVFTRKTKQILIWLIHTQSGAMIHMSDTFKTLNSWWTIFLHSGKYPPSSFEKPKHYRVIFHKKKKQILIWPPTPKVAMIRMSDSFKALNLWWIISLRLGKYPPPSLEKPRPYRVIFHKKKQNKS